MEGGADLPGRLDPCSRCGRTFLDLRQAVSIEALRGAVPLCPLPACPLLARVRGLAAPPPAPSGNVLFGPSPPSVFVGRHGYPRVAIGPLLPPGGEPDPRVEDGRALAALGIGDVLALRAGLVRSKTLVDVHAPRDPGRTLDAARELAMSTSPVETEVTLAKPARLDFTPRVDGTSAPMGPSVEVVRARLTESPSVPRRVDAIVSDVHADAATGLWELYESGVPTHHLQRLLSVGLLGEAQRRRLVPTRWSITATDDTLGRRVAEEVKGRPAVGTIEHFQASLLGNRFQVLLLPRPWAFEMVEAWSTGAGGVWSYARDAEGHEGRSSYADRITGAYYAARLSVLEALARRGRQASVYVHREITDEYWAPLGVWVIREGVRAAMQSKPLVFGEAAAAIKHLDRRAAAKEWKRHAVLLRGFTEQRTLSDFAGS